MDELPKRFDFRAAEVRLHKLWEELRIGTAKADSPRTKNFVIDSPPPTVSGSLHIGHVFSYAHQDIIARQRRMLGYNVIYPMGWDDNGLPTERRVQNYFGVRAEFDADYIPDLDVDAERARLGLKKNQQLVISRRNFIELCWQITEQDEKVFEALFKLMGYSIDWALKYTTVSDYCRRIAQRSFIDLYQKGHIYQLDTPTMWDVDFQTAVAQAEVVDREESGAYHDIQFGVLDEKTGEISETFAIATTRPELLPACVGVAAHPADPRYKSLFGKHAITPLFFAKVPIFASEAVDMEKGVGILMVCTFGDQMDVQWWREHRLALRQIVGKNGRLEKQTFGTDGWESQNPALANANYNELAGKNLKQARAQIVELLRNPQNSVKGDTAPLQAEPRQIQHSVRYYERGDRPLEYLSQRQWFVKLQDKKDLLLKKGAEINWHPAFMQKRYASWTENLNTDWCISRQRYFGVPIPVWYKLDAKGEPDFDKPIIAPEAKLPIDPALDAPPGYTAEQRDRPNGFTAERDVFDTWFTSSMSPQIVSQWGEPNAKFENFMPMDIRPQSHEIIRTWAFYTIVKSALHHNAVPWHNVIISGWILDPDRKKMSKSKGNVVTPSDILEQFGTDAVRYWAGSARLGVDTKLDENVFKIGGKLVTKIFNAAKFVYLQGIADAQLAHSQITNELDRALIAELRQTITQASAHFENYEFSRALEATEDFFWNAFTDYYIELVKGRTSPNAENTNAKNSALATLKITLANILRLFAPFIPVVTDEVWSWHFADETGYRSIHQAPWPSAKNEPANLTIANIPAPKAENIFALACDTTAAIRKAKSEAGVSLKAPLKSATITCPTNTKATLTNALPDIATAANIATNLITLTEAKTKNCQTQIQIANA